MGQTGNGKEGSFALRLRAVFTAFRHPEVINASGASGIRREITVAAALVPGVSIPQSSSVQTGEASLVTSHATVPLPAISEPLQLAAATPEDIARIAQEREAAARDKIDSQKRTASKLVASFEKTNTCDTQELSKLDAFESKYRKYLLWPDVVPEPIVERQEVIELVGEDGFDRVITAYLNSEVYRKNERPKLEALFRRLNPIDREGFQKLEGQLQSAILTIVDQYSAIHWGELFLWVDPASPFSHSITVKDQKGERSESVKMDKQNIDEAYRKAGTTLEALRSEYGPITGAQAAILVKRFDNAILEYIFMNKNPNPETTENVFSLMLKLMPTIDFDWMT